ncbi:hypothetical protein GUJ93_ZPchr0014g47328 [Zizania palustris]|uniref:Uncharacterized protein n=1 Tax=Zizania palustris TaxID=103762 RepID=A0A8J5SX97_ZIZPA|nr:hypothetical protein GUJ93_ZPchr0014g47328 [Zizania palustris]
MGGRWRSWASISWFGPLWTVAGFSPPSVPEWCSAGGRVHFSFAIEYGLKNDKFHPDDAKVHLGKHQKTKGNQRDGQEEYKQKDSSSSTLSKKNDQADDDQWAKDEDMPNIIALKVARRRWLVVEACQILLSVQMSNL